MNTAPAAAHLDLPAPRTNVLAAHPRLIDACVAVGYVLVLLPGLVHQLAFGGGPLAARIAALGLTVLIGVALWYRRRSPLTVIAVVTACALVKSLCGFIDPLGLLLAGYATAVYAPIMRAGVALGAAAAASTIGALIGLPLTDLTEIDPRTMLILMLVPCAIAVLLGFLVRTLRTLREVEHQRFMHSVQERMHATELAAVRERAALSREMHDVVGHSLTAIINLSDGALRSSAVDPRSLRDGLQRINAIARDALGETRGILSQLRTDGETAPLHPAQPPSLSTATSAATDAADLGIPALLETAGSTGLSTQLTIEGDPVPVSADVRGAVYRIVQEAVTNAMRHAKDVTRIDVYLTYIEDAVTVQIVDDGTTSKQGSTRMNAEGGLRGAEQRATLLEGAFDFGPAPAGGWHVTASVPTHARIPV